MGARAHLVPSGAHEMSVSVAGLHTISYLRGGGHAGRGVGFSAVAVGRGQGGCGGRCMHVKRGRRASARAQLDDGPEVGGALGWLSHVLAMKCATSASSSCRGVMARSAPRLVKQSGCVEGQRTDVRYSRC